MDNLTLFQFFHWYYPQDGSLWNVAGAEAERLSRLGVSHVWLPPAYKGADGKSDVGYAVYDHFDLGEFNQKGSISTKYGTRQQYVDCIKSLQQAKLQVLADIILNHKQGADEKEKVLVQKTNPENRNEFLGEPEELDLYTRYAFPGRNKKYSDFIWDWKCFTGIDGETEEGYVIYKILNEYGPEWNRVIDEELGNFDYLMGADIEVRNPFVREELKKWIKWYCDTTGVDGFRLDAVKHMPPEFVNEWLDFIRTEMKRDMFSIAEYWSPSPDILKMYIDKVEGRAHLMDVPLHNKFHEVGKEEAFDLRELFKNTLIEKCPDRTITFVDNHDTQPLQTLESMVADWFKPMAYACILLRMQGIPCVFYPDFYGVSYRDEKKVVNIHRVPKLRKLMKARKYLAYGEQHDAFINERLIAWTRSGIEEKTYSGLCVLLNITDRKEKIPLCVGCSHANKEFVELIGGGRDVVKTDGEGKAAFLARPGQPSVWIRKEAMSYFEKK